MTCFFQFLPVCGVPVGIYVIALSTIYISSINTIDIKWEKGCRIYKAIKCHKNVCFLNYFLITWIFVSVFIFFVWFLSQIDKPTKGPFVLHLSEDLFLTYVLCPLHFWRTAFQFYKCASETFFFTFRTLSIQYCYFSELYQCCFLWVCLLPHFNKKY